MLVKFNVLYTLDASVPKETLEGEDHGWRCLDPNGSSSVYSLKGLPADFFNEINTGDSASSYLSISSANIIKRDDNHKDEIRINPGAKVSVLRGKKKGSRALRQRGRRLAVLPTSRTGNHTTLVVRVTDETGDSPNKTATEISHDVFGPAPFDVVNLVSQAYQCHFWCL